MYERINGLDVYTEIIGEGLPFLTIHGFYPDHRVMKGCLEPIFKPSDKIKRIYFDLPGMGRTLFDTRLENSDDMLSFVEAFIERIIGDQPYMVAGESYGGYLARKLVSHQKEKILGMLLICPMIEADKAKRQLPKREILSKDLILWNQLSREEKEDLETIAVTVDERIWERYQKEIVPAVQAADAERLEKFRNEGYAFKNGIPDEHFERPCLFLAGRQDDSTGYRDLYDIIECYPRATFAVLDGAGHNLQIEKDKTFEILVEEWISRVLTK
jgi:pimeloyl-ACP methyl ester carboxylesterase